MAKDFDDSTELRPEGARYAERLEVLTQEWCDGAG